MQVSLLLVFGLATCASGATVVDLLQRYHLTTLQSLIQSAGLTDVLNGAGE